MRSRTRSNSEVRGSTSVRYAVMTPASRPGEAPGEAIGSLRRVTPRAWVAEPAEAEIVAGLLVEFRDHNGHDWPSPNSFLASVERLIEQRDTCGEQQRTGGRQLGHGVHPDQGRE